MASNFTDILRSKKIISEDQLTEANRLAGESGKMLHEELLRLGYASPDKIMKALAKSNFNNTLLGQPLFLSHHWRTV